MAHAPAQAVIDDGIAPIKTHRLEFEHYRIFTMANLIVKVSPVSTVSIDVYGLFRAVDTEAIALSDQHDAILSWAGIGITGIFVGRKLTSVAIGLKIPAKIAAAAVVGKLHRQAFTDDGIYNEVGDGLFGANANVDLKISAHDIDELAIAIFFDAHADEEGAGLLRHSSHDPRCGIDGQGRTAKEIIQPVGWLVAHQFPGTR